MMSRDDHFERPFEEHTLLKHFVLESYLKVWASILLERSKGRHQRVIYVDAFAGAGADAQGNPGSPLLAAQIAQEFNERLYPDRASMDSDPGMHVIAVEQDPTRFQRLASCLAPFTAAPNAFVHMRNGVADLRLVDRIRGIEKDEPVFFFLDPFGIGGLDAALLPNLLADKRSELLVLFSDEAAVRLHGKGAAVPKDPMRKVRAAEATMSLFGADHEAEVVEQAQRAASRVIAGHKSDARAREIMEKAFGGAEYVATVDAAPSERRQQVMIELYSDLLRRSGAKHVLPIAVRTKTGRHKYTLLHASKHVRAFEVMKKVVNSAINKQSAGADLITETDLAPIVALVQARFAGQVVRWTAEAGPSVKQVAIEETNLMLHECAALKRELDRFVVDKRPLTFRF